MRKILPLFVFLILTSFTSLAQKIDYDNSSKWFLGFNVGTTWQTTDVNNKFGAGYGFVLGRSFNYNYGKVVSFDLRMRYLHGFWYGQDFDSTSLLNYSGGALDPYKNAYGFTVNNFRTNVHRLSLELAIHLNALHERSGFDPYIFGGIGLTWYQTKGDLYNSNSFTTDSLYEYNTMELSKSVIKSTLDKNYESFLDGSGTAFNVKVMPSIGFGIGYQVGKRTTIGFEHKTTFTLVDNFDGYAKASERKDIYHYTNFYVNFYFKNHKRQVYKDTTSSVGNIGNYNQTNINCTAPVVRFLNPQNNNQFVSTPNYQIRAEVLNVSSKNEITLKINGVSVTFFNYNTASHQLETSINLVPGYNTIEIEARNNCGSDYKSTTINYQQCISPTVQFTNPSVNNTTVNSQALVLGANIYNLDGGTISYTVNGKTYTNYSYNSSTGAFSHRATLIPGANTFVITASNACGSVTQTITVYYQNQQCISPTVQFTNPSVNNTTVNSQALVLGANIYNLDGGTISYTVNGKTYTNYSYNSSTGAFSHRATLIPGANTFVITASNACGSVTQTITINYQQCVSPTVQFTNPSVNNTTVNSQALVLGANIYNLDGGTISYTVNGKTYTNYSYNSSTGAFSHRATLIPGANTFVITASNACGSVTQTITINYQQCISPTVQFTNPTVNNTTVNSQALVLGANIYNLDGGNISYTVNGKTYTNYSYNSSTGAFSHRATLIPGANTFVITASNACGSVTQTITINYQQCVSPTVQFTNPSVNNTTVNSQALVLGANIYNLDGGTISYTVNGKTYTNYSYNSSTGAFSHRATLIPGANTFVITASNACGSVTQTITINYQQCVSPTVQFTNPSVNNTTVNSQALVLGANIYNLDGGTISYTVNGKTYTNYSYNSSTGAFSHRATLIPGANTFVITASNACGSVTQTITINYQQCISPTVQFTNPSVNNTTVNSQALVLGANIYNLDGGTISYTVNGKTYTNYSYNSSTGAFSHRATLIPGANTFVITASNACGSVTQTITINYQQCVSPTVQFTNPSVNNTTVNSQALVLGANIYNLDGGTISYTVNGKTYTNYSYNSSTGAFSHRATLVPGANTFVITASNACGSVTQTITINYNSCNKPEITLISPTAAEKIAAANQVLVQVRVKNFQNTDKLTLLLNKKAQGTMVYDAGSGIYSATIMLVSGNNLIEVIAENACGSDSESINLTYTACTAPEIQQVNPNSGSTTVNTASFMYQALIKNLNGGTIVFKLNGKVQKYSLLQLTNKLTATLNLQNGTNTIELQVTNACGKASVQQTIIYQQATDNKIVICHIPPGNESNPQTITIPESAWPAHAAHGDYKGSCRTESENGNSGSNTNGSGGTTTETESEGTSTEGTVKPIQVTPRVVKP